MYNPTRPKAGEDEATILKEEKAFLESIHAAHGGRSFQPAATVVRKSGDGRGYVEGKKVEIGKYGNRCPEESAEADEEMMDVEHPAENVMESRIVEKQFDTSKLMEFTTQTSIPSSSFKKLDAKVLTLTHDGDRMFKKIGKGKSLFAQMFDATHDLKEDKVDIQTGSKGGSSERNFGEKLHPYLAGMTEAEILNEQKKLLERLDPKLVEFVKSRKGGVDCASMSSTELQNDVPLVETERLDYSDLPIDPRIVKTIPGMDTVEMDKLEWAGLIKEERKTFEKLQEGDNARFDFRGVLMTAADFLKDDKTIELGLHHHGVDMEKPGYTMEELLLLSRSVNRQQKALALQVIGNIYKNAHTGLYDLAFEKSLFALSDYMDFVYVIRKSLDEEDTTVVNSAIQCLANIVYNPEEEICLDSVYLWEFSMPHPWIGTKAENLNSALELGDREGELKDSEMLEVDFLEFLIHRSNLLDRFVYLLSGDSLEGKGIEGILKMLVRFARHSPHTIVKNNHLIKLLSENCLNHPGYLAAGIARNLHGPALPLVLKILRILVDSSINNALILYNQYKIFPSVMAFVAHDDWGSEVNSSVSSNLVLESFRIWISLLSQGIAVEEYKCFFPVLMKFLILYQQVHPLKNFDLLHSGYVFSLLITILKMPENNRGHSASANHSHWTLVKDAVSCVENVLIKLLQIVGIDQLIDLYEKDTIFWSLSKGILFLSECFKYGFTKISPRLIESITSFLSSTLYQSCCTRRLRDCSVILQSPNGSRYPKNLSFVNAITFGGAVNPIVRFGNALPFLTSLVTMQNILTEQIPRALIINEDVQLYLSKILQSHKQAGNSDFFVRFEMGFLLRLLQSSSDDSQTHFYLAYKAVSIAPLCCTKLFNDLFKIALTMSCPESNLEDCCKIYGGYFLEGGNASFFNDSEVPAKKVKFSEDSKRQDGPSTNEFSFRRWENRCVESHWILEPFEKILTIVTSTPGFLSKNLNEIGLQCKICLQLIKKCLQSHVNFVIQTPKDFVEVYCAVCKVFLMGDPSIYVDRDINNALISILKDLLNSDVIQKWKSKQIFSSKKKDTELANTFNDFYQALVREYSENSYFNQVFAAYLMIPLRLPEDAQIRSNFWTMETLKLFKVNKNESLIPLEYVTDGVEKDKSLLHNYIRLLKSGTVTSTNTTFLYAVVTTILRGTFSVTLNDSDGDQMMQHLRDSFMQFKM